MKVLVLGNGWLGQQIAEFLEADKYEARIYDPSFLNEEKYAEYDVWINAIGKTNIDWCEKNKREAFAVNAALATDIAQIARDKGIRYVYLSSACVFESSSLHDEKFEDSTPNPQCFYARTKAIAEELIEEAYPQSLIVRLRLPIGEQPHPRNTLTKLLNYDKINNNQESVTIVEDFLPALKKLISGGASGIYHLVNEGTISPSSIAELLHHPHVVVTKHQQDERLAVERRAKRVTAIIGSKRIKLLPNINERLPEVIGKFNAHRRV